MTDRMELLEAAFDSFPEGMGLFGGEDEVVFWNQAAQGITGYPAVELLGRQLPECLEPLLAAGSGKPEGIALVGKEGGCRSLVQARHKLGHAVPVMARVLFLRNGLGERIGGALLFHPAESLDALPQGESSAERGVAESRAELEERLQMEFDDFERGGCPLGVLWISVDQTEELRGTHGEAACNAMLEKVRHAMARGLRPTEEMGRWGDAEFLIVAHERSADMLAVHAQMLAGLARTADFRWWGDCVSITVSIGAAQAGSDCTEGLAQLLRRAREAMEASSREGGNHVSAAVSSSAAPAAHEDSSCSPS
ncbi:MAG TPA: diguanylate cyclase [Terracidiphilus sp.]|nr:diguanylate cyclase [Terracidiphilus sp.]